MVLDWVIIYPVMLATMISAFLLEGNVMVLVDYIPNFIFLSEFEFYCIDMFSGL